MSFDRVCWAESKMSFVIKNSWLRDMVFKFLTSFDTFFQLQKLEKLKTDFKFKSYKQKSVKRNLLNTLLHT